MFKNTFFRLAGFVYPQRHFSPLALLCFLSIKLDSDICGFFQLKNGTHEVYIFPLFTILLRSKAIQETLYSKTTWLAVSSCQPQRRNVTSPL